MLLAALTLLFQIDSTPPRRVDDPGVVTTRQTITPAGAQAVLTGRVHGVAFGRDSDDVWVLVSGRPGALVHLAWATNRVLGRVVLDSLSSPGMQSIALDPVTRQPYLALGASIVDTHPKPKKNKKPKKKKSGRVGPPMRPVVRFAVVEGDSTRMLSELPTAGGTTGPLAIATTRDAHGHRIALVTLTDDDTLAVIDIQTGAVVRKLATGIAPFAAVIDSAGTVAYVSNWGGRRPRVGERWARTGDDSTADRVVIDARGVAATGTVTRLDLATGARTTIAVGLHPTAMVWDEPRHRIFVADGNADSVSVIETTTNTVVQTISLNPFAGHPFGVAPTAVAVSPDGLTLFVACGGVNAIAVVDIDHNTVRGLIPTAWYPASLAVSRDGRSLAVGAILGVGSGPIAPVLDAVTSDKGDERFFPHGPRPDARYVHAYRGTVSVIPVPDDTQLAAYTTAVTQNDRLSLTTPPADSTASWPTIDHVVYVVRENRSYDQVLGDIGKGNSDSSLTMYGRDITPNAHRLAAQFVLLDNFYATGGNSGDGHQWVTQANETEYTIWPGYGHRSYPKNGNDPLAYSKTGFIWNAAAERNKTIAIFGEYVGYLPKPKHESDSVALFELAKYRRGATYVGRFATRAPITAIQQYVVSDYPAYGTQIPNVARARIFARHVAHWDSTGVMPNLVIVQLPCDHTAGMTPGWTTPSAMVADNDLALGRIVDALSHSRFWGSMAIFIVEDDAQGGVDHVDGHRTVALAASPFIRHGTIDHTFYSQPSLLRTIEGILGLRHLTMFDLVANDLRASFSDSADLTPYTVQEPVQSIYEPNAEIAALSGPAKHAAVASATMNWREPDMAPAMTLNKILWHDVRGWATPYPEPTHAVFAPLAAPDPDP